MNQHEGVSCNQCSKTNFSGKRYKCLRCFDYDLCSVCYLANATSSEHSPKHPVQCIISRSDYELYYGGETLPAVNIPHSLTCPYCAQMGFTDVTLKEHATDKHYGTSFQVICPICASTSSGDPNFMVSDLVRHLTVAHNIENRRRISFNIDEQLNRISGMENLISTNTQLISAPRIRPHCPIVVGRGQETPILFSTTNRRDPINNIISQISRMRQMNNSTSGAPLEHRNRLQAIRMEINESRQQAGIPNLFVLPNPVDVEVPDIINQEPQPNAPGFAALLPNIINESSSETSVDKTRAAFIKELVYSVMLCETPDEEITTKFQ